MNVEKPRNNTGLLGDSPSGSPPSTTGGRIGQSLRINGGHHSNHGAYPSMHLRIRLISQHHANRLHAPQCSMTKPNLANNVLQ